MRAFAFLKFGLLTTTLVASMIAMLMVSSSWGDDAEPRERVILMTTGRVLTGYAYRNAGGWLVEQSNGRVQVPIDQVRVVADSMVEVYRKQRDSVVEPTPATHVALAQWCISYRLFNEAQDELRKCLKLDPDNSSARKLLRRVEEMLEPADSKLAPADRAPKRTAEGFLVPDAESLGGLSNEAAVTFTQRIQPLLVNKCGNASCHGTTSNSGEKLDGFHLMAVRSGSNGHRMYTERNLAEVLRFVDLDEPTLSPLVTIPQGSHGGIAGVFHGTAGSAQIKMLRNWLKTVAEQKIADEKELESTRSSLVAKTTRPQEPTGTTSTPPIRGLEQSPFPVTQTSGTLPAAPNAPPKPSAAAPRDSAASGAPQELTPHQRQGQPVATAKPSRKDDEKPGNDPFDPDIFNRRFHSPSRR